jgi:hypothetical protein
MGNREKFVVIAPDDTDRFSGLPPRRANAQTREERAFMEFLHIPTGTQRAINLTKRKEDPRG